MKSAKLLLIFLPVLLLIGCNAFVSSKDSPDEIAEKLEFFDTKLNFMENNQVSKYSEIEKNLTAITVDSNNTYKVVKSDDRYQIIREDSVTGDVIRTSDKIDAVLPKFIKVENEITYVLDVSLNQIIIFNNELKKINTINLIKEDADAQILDFEILDGKIYYTLQTTIESAAHIFILSQDGETKKIGSHFLGYLSVYEGSLYAVTTQEYFNDGKFNGFRSGKNSLYVVNNDVLEEKFSFWAGYSPLDFIVENGKVFVLGGSSTTLDVFDFTNGKYIHSIAQVDDAFNIRSLLTKKENDFYVFLLDNGNIWKVESK